ncbi:MAG TPA: KH domain-containing protein [Candidatus Saccharimonadales bacterium]|nr:KH domain-containing protein [Candidatus Saccharimonadales bacterium]
MNNSIDQQFVEFIVKSLVGNPDAVIVERRIDEKGVLLELTVDPEDLGRVIGKRGATAQSLRTLLRALGTKNDARYNLKIVDNGEPENGGGSSTRAPRDDAASDDTATTTNPQHDDLDDADAEGDAKAEPESDVIARARKELADLDDLDV